MSGGMKPTVSRTENAVGALILLALLCVCVWVYQRQARFDPSVLVISVRPEPTAGVAESLPSVPSSSSFQSWLPDGFSALGPSERFGPETLSEKIDGKAELYLSSGFAGLECQRFSGAANGSSWFEIFVYDMGNSRNAFSVFSSQRRAEGLDVDLTRFAYRTPNALFLAHGKEYLEIIGSDEGLGTMILIVGKAFVEARPLGGDDLGDLGLFAADGLDTSSITLLSANVFGYEKLDATYTAVYSVGQWRLMAFVSRRGAIEEASRLAGDYVRFLLENGGKEIESSLAIPGGKVIQVFDTTEVVFSRGGILAGVHEADDREAAVALAARLYDALPR